MSRAPHNSASRDLQRTERFARSQICTGMFKKSPARMCFRCCSSLAGSDASHLDKNIDRSFNAAVDNRNRGVQKLLVMRSPPNLSAAATTHVISIRSTIFLFLPACALLMDMDLAVMSSSVVTMDT